MLEDVLFHFSKPCVMDVKIGKVTFDPHANDAKKESEMAKCPYQFKAGFRPLGYRIYKEDPVNPKLKNPKITYSLKTQDRNWGKLINKENAESCK